MIDFTQYTPEELSLLAFNLALILSKDRTVEELSVMSSFLLVISDTISLIAAQKANLNALKEKALEKAQENKTSKNQREPL